MTSIAMHYQAVTAGIAKAARDASRSADDITLLAVSKGQPVDKMQALYTLGQRQFGENYLQEAIPKIKTLSWSDALWHYIGHVQSNKTREIAEHFDWLHALDHLKHAERLSEQRPADMDPLNVCICVNIDENPKKSGIAADDLLDFAGAVGALPRIRLRGLMVIPDPRDSIDAQFKVFSEVAALQASLVVAGFDCDTLSMGMSDDFSSAIRAGSTIVRIGTKLFGPRQVR